MFRWFYKKKLWFFYVAQVQPQVQDWANIESRKAIRWWLIDPALLAPPGGLLIPRTKRRLLLPRKRTWPTCPILPGKTNQNFSLGPFPPPKSFSFPLTNDGTANDLNYVVLFFIIACTIYAYRGGNLSFLLAW